MSQPLYFYTIDEHTDIDWFCKLRRIKPYKTKTVSCTDEMINYRAEVAIQYIKKDFVYDVLEFDECYSGYETTLMRLPELSYDSLIDLALNTKHRSELEGAIGIILKKYSRLFEQYLLNSMAKPIKENLPIKRIVRFVNSLSTDGMRHIPTNDIHVQNIFDLCKSLQAKLC